MSHAEKLWLQNGFSKYGVELIVWGYSRLCHKELEQNNMIPDDLMELILRYCYQQREIEVTHCKIYGGKIKSQFPKRITKEMERIKKVRIPGIIINVDETNYRHFEFIIAGPKDTPFENGTFRFEAFLTLYYPMKNPKIRCLTKIYHPQFDKLGRISMDILSGHAWTPALNLQKIALSLQSLIECPNPDDPLDNAIAEMYKTDLKQAQQIAREWTQKYAI